MRIAYFTAGSVGAGHRVRGLAIARALDRAGFRGCYRTFGPARPFDAARSGLYGEERAELVPIQNDPALRDPRLAATSDLAERLRAFAPDLLIVDLFWGPLRWVLRHLGCEAWLLVRTCPPIWLEGRADLPFEPELFRRRFAIEPIAHPHLDHALDPIVIANPDECRPRDEVRDHFGVAHGAPLSLVVHAGERGEVAELERVAGSAAITLDLFEPDAPFPAAEWLPAADHIVSAAGYNSFWEARWLGYDARTTFVPFPRSIDDQASRIAEFRTTRPRANGADSLAAMILAGG